MSGCSGTGIALSPTGQSVEMTLYSWVDYMPQTVMDNFEREFGVRVNYVIYETQEEAVENIGAGVGYDLVIFGPEYIPGLIEDGYLKPLEYEHIPNFKYISLNFRELAFDPGNKYTIPFHWGNTGLLVRTDLVNRPITSWSDLWDPAFAGKVGIWNLSRDMISIALKASGYSINTSDPQELEAARQRLLALQPNIKILRGDESSIVPALATGEFVMGYGWAYDATLAEETGLPIEYIIPEEGSILWSDHWVVPANAPNPLAAHAFINYILRPEISAEIINYSYYPIPNDAATSFIDDAILNNRAIYPPPSSMKKAELILPLTAETERLYEAIWDDFISPMK